MLATIQADFARALLDPGLPLPGSVIAHTTSHPHRRFAVYRNNVAASLINALRAKFAATERIVGEDFFAAMARVFVTAHPPRSKILHLYGDDFGDFVAGFEPAGALPYLADVARLEAARTRAYHAADVIPLDPGGFVHIGAHDIAALRLRLHPSLHVLRSHHPVVTIWAMNTGELPLGAIDDSCAEDTLVLRPDLDVVVRSLPPGGAAFLLALADGNPLAISADHAAADDNRFDLTTNLADLIGAGAVTGVALSQTCP